MDLLTNQSYGPTVLGDQVPPLLAETKEIGPLVPVPTMMQVVAEVQAMSIAPKFTVV
jgi:hypothetical protein